MSMSTNHAPIIAAELELAERSVSAALALFDGGATIPFVARYRKERTGALDEVALRSIRDRRSRLLELDARKEAVLASLDHQGIDDPKLRDRILSATTRTEVEDLYLPYRPKRRTRAAVARERGLEPLADLIWRGDATVTGRDGLERAASELVDATTDLPDTDAVLSGVRDILAERVSEMPSVRSRLRKLFRREAVLSSKRKRGAEDVEAAKFRDYFDWHEPARKAPSHRILAVMRGCREGALSSSVRPSVEAGEAVVRRGLEEEVRLPRESAARFELLSAAADACDRLLMPQIETEYRNDVVARAEAEAIGVFARNLRELLMAPPFGARRVLGIDPGFRTGCKVVALSESGDLRHFETIYPLEPKRDTAGSGVRLGALVSQYLIEGIAVGNGTGGKETVEFCRSLSLPDDVVITMVDESGASVYSASEGARREMPDQDLTVRGAVSIGRRLQDPLAELVKIEPKAIGVGQYQHDVDQKLLTAALEDVVVSCVNAVGVEVNTASAALLRFVSGISESVAEAIVEHRRRNGAFAVRSELLAVPGLGPRSYEQAAGFLRIRDGENPLDAGAVHPERYGLVERMAADSGVAVGELVGQSAIVEGIDPNRYVSEDVGLPTVRDILAELAKPGRDPRREFVAFEFARGVESIEDLSVGMELPGIVTNVTAFGAFVDIGIHNDGLVHISRLADRFVEDPHQVVKVQQQVAVRVVSIDKERSRIGLSMREGDQHE